MRFAYYYNAEKCQECGKILEFDSIEQGGFWCDVHNAKYCYKCWDNHWIHLNVDWKPKF